MSIIPDRLAVDSHPIASLAGPLREEKALIILPSSLSLSL